MEAQELRIGNLLKRGYDIVEVSAIFRSHFNCTNKQTGVDYGNNHQSNYIPIPLTPEWLERFGFTNPNIDWIYEKYPIKVNVGNRNEVSVHHKACRCEYIHQLQNLYFALTGTELTLKEEENTK